MSTAECSAIELQGIVVTMLTNLTIILEKRQEEKGDLLGVRCYTRKKRNEGDKMPRETLTDTPISVDSDTRLAHFLNQAKQARSRLSAESELRASEQVSDDEILSEHYLDAVIDALEGNPSVIRVFSSKNPALFIRGLTRALYPEYREDSQEFSEKVTEVSHILNEITKGYISEMIMYRAMKRLR